ncbi:hypothetical protein ANN_09792 [Periplaneta americana]|uniref:Uncharacterized protein n=1 Tax=Periplaneta americana TaxID=6978 RepID=A0ABQ8TQA0_PERAM|nr:hypothetical protein ANN_09792 [Periplaneta americana]
MRPPILLETFVFVEVHGFERDIGRYASRRSETNTNGTEFDSNQFTDSAQSAPQEAGLRYARDEVRRRWRFVGMSQRRPRAPGENHRVIWTTDLLNTGYNSEVHRGSNPVPQSFKSSALATRSPRRKSGFAHHLRINCRAADGTRIPTMPIEALKQGFRREVTHSNYNVGFANTNLWVGSHLEECKRSKCVLPDNSNAKENRPSENGLLQIRHCPPSVTETDDNTPSMKDLHQISDASSDVDDPKEFVSATYSTSLHSSEKGKEKNLQAFHGNLTEKRKRSSKPHKDKWKKMKNRKLRMEEEAYLSYKRSKDGKVTHDTERDARNLGPECSYKMCQNSKVRGCNLISNERRHIFQAFWKTMTWEQRTVHVSNLVNFTPTKRPGSTNSESRRKRTFVYNLKVNEKKIQVYKMMYSVHKAQAARAQGQSCVLRKWSHRMARRRTKKLCHVEANDIKRITADGRALLHPQPEEHAAVDSTTHYRLGFSEPTHATCEVRGPPHTNPDYTRDSEWFL